MSGVTEPMANALPFVQAALVVTALAAFFMLLLRGKISLTKLRQSRWWWP